MASENANKNNLIWIDLEMTGLIPEKDKILEIAIVPTDSDLNILHPGFFEAVKHSKSIVDEMDEWSRNQHQKTGLIDDCLNSKYTLQELEKLSIDYCLKYINAKDGIMSGNSIFQDKAFIRLYMSKLNDIFHYRIIDVSSIKELVKRWYPYDKEYEKENHHRADKDIYESINELKFFRDNYFISPY